jgi:hypothetical protein
VYDARVEEEGSEEGTLSSCPMVLSCSTWDVKARLMVETLEGERRLAVWMTPCFW